MTENENKEDGLAAMAGAQDIPGEEITQEQMEAEGADKITDAQVDEAMAQATAQIKADPIANAVRGLAIGIVAAINKDMPVGKKVDQSHPSVQIMEPALDLVFFAVSGINRMAAALEQMAEAQARLADLNERALQPAFVVNLEQVAQGEQPTEAEKAQGI